MRARTLSVRQLNYLNMLSEGIRMALCMVAPGSLSYLLCARRWRCHAARRAAARPLARRAAIDRMRTARRSCIVLGRDAVMLLFMARG